MALLIGVGDFGIGDLLAQTQLAQTEAVAAKTVAVAAAAGIQEGLDLGPWNVATNVPTLSANVTGVANGSYYNVVVSGAVTFAGSNFAVGQVFVVGDRIAKLTDGWYRRPFAVPDDSITPDKVSFIQTGKNLVNKNDPENAEDRFVNHLNGTLSFADQTALGSKHWVTHFVPVMPLTAYMPNQKKWLAFYDSNRAFISGLSNTRTDQGFTTPAGAFYVRLTFALPTLATAQLEKGSVVTAYEAYSLSIQGVDVPIADGSLSGVKLANGSVSTTKLPDGAVTGAKLADNSISTNKLPDDAVTPAKVSFIQTGKNLFDKTDPGIVEDRFINHLNGELLVADTATVGKHWVSHFIPVTVGVTYVPSQKKWLAFYDANKVFVSGQSNTRTNQFFTVPTGAVYVRLTYASANLNAAQLEVGEVNTIYEAYAQELIGVSVPVPNGSILGAKLADGSISTSKLSDGAITGEKIADGSIDPTTKLPDGSITPVKLSFIEGGKNLFDKDSPGNVEDFFVNHNTGTLLPADTATVGKHWVTYYIPVTPGTLYMPSQKKWLAFYDSQLTFISGLANTRADQFFTTPANTAFVRLTFASANLNAAQLELGNVATAYEAYRLTLSGVSVDLADQSVTTAKVADASISTAKLPDGAVTGVKILDDAISTAKVADGAITPSKVSFVETGKNLFDKNDPGIVEDRFINHLNGTLSVADPAVIGKHWVSHFIAVAPNTTYVPSQKKWLAFYNTNRVFISGLSNSRTDQPFTTPAGTAFVRLTFASTNLNAAQLEVGSVQTGYEAYRQFLTIPQPTDDRYGITIAPKLYWPGGREVGIYPENLHKDYGNWKGRTSIVAPGGKQTGRSGKFSVAAGNTAAVTVAVYDRDFEVKEVRNVSVQGVAVTSTTAVNVLNIGDSFTQIGAFANKVLANTTGVTFLGIRNTGGAATVIPSEGRSGWTMARLSTLSKTVYAAFVQPSGAYVYLGNTEFWIQANGATPGVEYGDFVTAAKTRFSATTGYPLAPMLNEVIYDNTLSKFIVWDGTGWVEIAEAALTFSVNVAKYRSAWGIPAPGIVHILMGANDFAFTSASATSNLYTSFHAQYWNLIASLKADVPAVKIIVGLPVSSARQGVDDVALTAQRKRAYWICVDCLIRDFAGREAENIYVADYHSTVDREYGFTRTLEAPYENYTGTATEPYTSDITHLSADGWKVMAEQYFALIQLLRG